MALNIWGLIYHEGWNIIVFNHGNLITTLIVFKQTAVEAGANITFHR